MTAAPLAYYGGKSATANSGTGRWIANQLPDCETYIEPFGGMWGVLLQRPVSPLEIVNDADHRLITFWLTLRDQSEALADRLWMTPYSYVEWHNARDRLKDPTPRDPLLLATDVATMLAQGHAKAISTAKGNGWKRVVGGTMSGHRPSTLTLPDRIVAAAERIRNVQIECTDAVTLLTRRTIRKHTGAVIYADPPYRNADTTAYAEGLDWQAFIEALLAQRGRVAVSGYVGDMPELEAEGWRIETRNVTETASTKMGDRTEALWMNYAAPEARLF